MSEIVLQPTDEDLLRFYEAFNRVSGLHEVVAFGERVQSLGRLILDGELIQVGTNLAIDGNDDAHELAGSDFFEHSIIGRGVKVDDETAATGGEKHDEDTEPLKATRVTGSLISDTTLQNATISESVVHGCVVDQSIVRSSRVTKFAISRSEIAHSDLLNDFDRNKFIKDSTVKHSSLAYKTSIDIADIVSGIVVADSQISHLDSTNSIFEEGTTFNFPISQTFRGAKNKIVSSNLHKVQAWKTELDNVTACETQFGEHNNRLKPEYWGSGGKLRYITFLPGSTVLRTFGGGAPGLIPEVTGPFKDLDLIVTRNSNGSAQLHPIKR